MRKPLLFPLVALSAFVLAGMQDSPVRYTIDSGPSNVSAKVGFFGIGSKTAQFPKMSGSAALPGGRPEQIELDVKIDARALQAPDKVTLKRLRGEKFFWVEKYPTVRFQGSNMKMSTARNGTVRGNLTARGVTKPVTLDVTFDRAPSSLNSGQPLSLTGTTTISRRDFGMTAYSLIVGKKVDITIKARMVPS